MKNNKKSRFKTVSRCHLEKELKNAGFQSIGGSKHEKWKHPNFYFLIELPRHRVISSGVTYNIYKKLQEIVKTN
jgi:hypothetical protein